MSQIEYAAERMHGAEEQTLCCPASMLLEPCSPPATLIHSSAWKYSLVTSASSAYMSSMLNIPESQYHLGATFNKWGIDSKIQMLSHSLGVITLRRMYYTGFRSCPEVLRLVHPMVPCLTWHLLLTASTYYSLSPLTYHRVLGSPLK